MSDPWYLDPNVKPGELVPKSELDQALGALGYPVPGNTPSGKYKCGLCEAKNKEIERLKFELARQIGWVDD